MLTGLSQLVQCPKVWFPEGGFVPLLFHVHPNRVALACVHEWMALGLSAISSWGRGAGVGFPAFPGGMEHSQPQNPLFSGGEQSPAPPGVPSHLGWVPAGPAACSQPCPQIADQGKGLGQVGPLSSSAVT